MTSVVTRRNNRVRAKLQTRRYLRFVHECNRETEVIKSPRSRYCVECKGLITKGTLIRLRKEQDLAWHYASTWESCWQYWIRKQLIAMAEQEDKKKHPNDWE